MHSTVFGFALVLIAAISGGALAVPLKKRQGFELENIYIPATLVMMLIFPLVMAAFVLPHWTEAVRVAGADCRRQRRRLRRWMGPRFHPVWVWRHDGGNVGGLCHHHGNQYRSRFLSSISREISSRSAHGGGTGHSGRHSGMYRRCGDLREGWFSSRT